MKNSFELRGDVAAIQIVSRSGAITETLVDAADIPMLSETPMSWSATWSVLRERIYVRSFSRRTGVIYLHRFLMQAPKGLDVDHINFDRLDNRRSNLRLVTRRENLLHRSGPNSNSTSGLRGVYATSSGKWYAQFDHQHLGTFGNKEDAAAVVAAAIEKAVA